MLVIRKSTLRKTLLVITPLAILLALAVVSVPGQPTLAETATCGDGICTAGAENNDLCATDCQCVDNGTVDASEGCGCKDVICAGESVSSACGTPAVNGACPDGLQPAPDGKGGQVCWTAACSPPPPGPEGKAGKGKKAAGFVCGEWAPCPDPDDKGSCPASAECVAHCGEDYSEGFYRWTFGDDGWEYVCIPN